MASCGAPAGFLVRRKSGTASHRAAGSACEAPGTDRVQALDVAVFGLRSAHDLANSFRELLLFLLRQNLVKPP